MLKSILDFIFPPKCLVCESRGKDVFCARCLQNIPHLKNIDKSGEFAVYSSARYDGVIKKALNAFKFRRKAGLAGPLAEIMIKTIEENNIIEKYGINLIVPVPIHKNKLKQRTYNQSELLARLIARRYNIKISSSFLLKTKDTPEQNKLTRKERLVNLKGSFSADAKKVIEKCNILLIDDVYTTGATVRECVKTLKKHDFCGSITALTLSRAI